MGEERTPGAVPRLRPATVLLRFPVLPVTRSRLFLLGVTLGERDQYEQGSILPGESRKHGLVAAMEISRPKVLSPCSHGKFLA